MLPLLVFAIHVKYVADVELLKNIIIGNMKYKINNDLTFRSEDNEIFSQFK